jgi:competence protein ComEC
VEQGDATLIVSPSGKTLLVDAGDGKMGRGKRIMETMRVAGVQKIDHFVCTHFHEDHYGGIVYLLKNEIPVGHAYVREDKIDIDPEIRNSEDYREYEKSIGNRVKPLTPGDKIDLSPVKVTCIASCGDVKGEKNPEPVQDKNENNLSIALLIEYGRFKYFTGGDIQESTEIKIADADLVTDVDVYKASHHGSHSSSCEDLMDDLKPQVIIISNGSNCKYQHPRKETLERYAELKPVPHVFQTNRFIMSKCKKDCGGGNVPVEFIADPETTDAKGTILVTVDNTSESYEISYLEKSYEFETKSIN